MALLQDLIKQIDDETLRQRIMAEVDKLTKQKKFGLIFEEHLPECTPLYDVCGVEHLRQNKEGRIQSLSLPDSDSVIEFCTDDILIGNIRPYLKKIWLADCNGGTNGDVLTIRLNKGRGILPRYLFYVLSSECFFAYDMKYAKGAKMPRGDKKAVMNYEIPVPPLEIQNEIVKLLDNFTELTAELTEQLMTELTLRKKQYNFYRDSLLNFVRVDDTIVQTDRQTDRQAQRISEFGLWRKTQHIEWKSLRDISVRISSGGTPRKTNSAYYTGGTIPWLRTQEVEFNYIEKATSFITEEGLKNSSAKWIPAHCVIVAISGATAGRSAVNNIPVTTNQHCCNIEVNEEMVEYKYVFYWVKSQYEKLKGLGRGARADLSAEIIANYPIPVPPLSEQCRIVSILDRFDALCNDLTSGLPAEIAARKKQYEHYRDKLLTFPRSNG